MTYTHLLKQYVFSSENALAFGFTREGADFVYRESAGGGLFLFLAVQKDGDEVTLCAKDEEFGEDYPLFDRESAGTFAAGLRERAEALWLRVLAACYGDRRLRPRLLAYLAARFDTRPDAPFAGDSETLALRCENGKWFGLLMTIPFSRLGVGSEVPVDVINVKLPPERIDALLDGVHFFRCYHMSHTHWVSIALTETLDWDLLVSAVGESHDLVAGGKKAGKANAKTKR